MSDLKKRFLIKKTEKMRRIAEKRKIDFVEHYRKQGMNAQVGFVREIHKDDPMKFRELMFQMCAVRLWRGDYSDWSGWEYRSEWSESSYKPDLPNRRWRLEPIRSLAVLGEQGVGDEILFGSCLPDVTALGIRVVVECDKRLLKIFERSFGVDTRERQDLSEKREEDAFIPIGDLPRLFRKSQKDFLGTPFLKPLPEMVEKWRSMKGKVGIAWRGRRGKVNPSVFGIENPVCLQYDSWEYETEGMEVPEGISLKDDMEDLLGICANLDEVRTVPQTIVHMSGPIGTKVSVIIPPKESGRVRDEVNYRYGNGGRNMDWYKSVYVYPSIAAWLNR